MTEQSIWSRVKRFFAIAQDVVKIGKIEDPSVPNMSLKIQKDKGWYDIYTTYRDSDWKHSWAMIEIDTGNVHSPTDMLKHVVDLKKSLVKGNVYDHDFGTTFLNAHGPMPESTRDDPADETQTSHYRRLHPNTPRWTRYEKWLMTQEYGREVGHLFGRVFTAVTTPFLAYRVMGWTHNRLILRRVPGRNMCIDWPWVIGHPLIEPHVHVPHTKLPLDPNSSFTDQLGEYDGDTGEIWIDKTNRKYHEIFNIVDELWQVFAKDTPPALEEKETLWWSDLLVNVKMGDSTIDNVSHVAIMSDPDFDRMIQDVKQQTHSSALVLIDLLQTARRKLACHVKSLVNPSIQLKKRKLID